MCWDGKGEKMTSHPTRDVWVEMSIVRRYTVITMSHPTRDVWVEIGLSVDAVASMLSHPTRDVWVEMIYYLQCQMWYESHPTRDVWVEMTKKHYTQEIITVTSHTGCVSRNAFETALDTSGIVTSHTGCVSRNKPGQLFYCNKNGSHPTRDVWVEICSAVVSSFS